MRLDSLGQVDWAHTLMATHSESPQAWAGFRGHGMEECGVVHEYVYLELTRLSLRWCLLLVRRDDSLGALGSRQICPHTESCDPVRRGQLDRELRPVCPSSLSGRQLQYCCP